MPKCILGIVFYGIIIIYISLNILHLRFNILCFYTQRLLLWIYPRKKYKASLYLRSLFLPSFLLVRNEEPFSSLDSTEVFCKSNL